MSPATPNDADETVEQTAISTRTSGRHPAPEDGIFEMEYARIRLICTLHYDGIFLRSSPGRSAPPTPAETDSSLRISCAGGNF
ncbi:hypothetical protein [Shinella zoogloeoides]|uniref:hypothetical protein n=1 Tax=Shinella zoogloeoides TaxID=352475 RepID=UPI00299CEDCB|nr:hypothetical protein [Shinella zoogloeoides]